MSAAATDAPTKSLDALKDKIVEDSKNMFTEKGMDLSIYADNVEFRCERKHKAESADKGTRAMLHSRQCETCSVHVHGRAISSRDHERAATHPACCC